MKVVLAWCSGLCIKYKKKTRWAEKHCAQFGIWILTKMVSNLFQQQNKYTNQCFIRCPRNIWKILKTKEQKDLTTH